MSRSAFYLIFAAGLSLAVPFSGGLEGIARADSPAPSASATAAAPGLADAATRDRFTGNFTYVGGDKQRAAIENAIDYGISNMFIVAKPIARGKLRDKTAIKNAVGFKFANGNVISTASDASPATSRDDGTPAPYVVDGETIRIVQKVTADGHLLQTFSTADGSRLNDYTLSADNKTLTMTVTLTSSRISHPVRYALTYRRTGA